jgi:hypothetical protein
MEGVIAVFQSIQQKVEVLTVRPVASPDPQKAKDSQQDAKSRKHIPFRDEAVRRPRHRRNKQRRVEIKSVLD